MRIIPALWHLSIKAYNTIANDKAHKTNFVNSFALLIKL